MKEKDDLYVNIYEIQYKRVDKPPYLITLRLLGKRDFFVFAQSHSHIRKTYMKYSTRVIPMPHTETGKRDFFFRTVTQSHSHITFDPDRERGQYYS